MANTPLKSLTFPGLTDTYTVAQPSSSTPADLGTAAAGSSGDFARADHVHNKPTYSASDVEAVAANQGAANAGKFLSIANDGEVTPVDLPVDPDAKTSAMTQSVGVDDNGKLWTLPGGGGGGITKTLISHVTITQNTASVGISGVSYENILIITSGLKTAKTSSMGAMISITGNQGSSPSGSLLYSSNVFVSISKQCGYCLIEELANGMKFIRRSNKPTSGAENAQDSIGLVNNAITVPLLLGTISEVTITPSESNYQFTGGDVYFYGW